MRAWGTCSAARRRPLLPTVMAGAAGLCVAVAMPVQAQEGTAPVAVFDQPREGLDPKGLDIGAFRLFPSLTVSETFDDNIFAEENGEQMDLITAVTGAVVARSEWTRPDFPFDARVRHDKFLDRKRVAQGESVPVSVEFG